MYGIKLSFFRSVSNIATLWIWIRYVLNSVWVVFINFLLLDTTDRTKISSNHHRIIFDVSLYPLSFFTRAPFKPRKTTISSTLQLLMGHCFLCMEVHLKLRLPFLSDLILLYFENRKLFFFSDNIWSNPRRILCCYRCLYSHFTNTHRSKQFCQLLQKQVCWLL